MTTYSKRLAIIAGGGELPQRLALHIRENGQEPLVVALRGFADDWINGFEHVAVALGEPGRAIKEMRSAGCDGLVFAGNVNRPDFSSLKLDMKGMRLLPKIMKAARRGDDALLRVIVDEFEAEGFAILGANDVLAELVPQKGVLGTVEPLDEHWADIRVAWRVATEIGRLDVGQGAIVCNGLVLAVEAQEGTDAMLARCATLPETIRGSDDARCGVLLKRPKPIQERRIDLPTIGVSTVQGAARAGLAGIVIEAGNALVLDRESLIAAADQLGLFILATDPDSVESP